MGRLRDLPRDQRPRERLFARGTDRLHDTELLALVLARGHRGRDVLALADELLTRLGSVGALASVEPGELARIPGVGPVRAAQLAAAAELGRRVLQAECGALPRVRTASDVHRLFVGRVAGRRRETFWVLALDARHRVEHSLRVAEGTLTSVEVHPREVFQPLIRRGAAATILVHNHPSGDPNPSAEDVSLTRRLVAVGDLVGIPVIDHVVVAGATFVSLSEKGLL
jgi:DNA repair protein RadC